MITLKPSKRRSAVATAITLAGVTGTGAYALQATTTHQSQGVLPLGGRLVGTASSAASTTSSPTAVDDIASKLGAISSLTQQVTNDYQQAQNGDNASAQASAILQADQGATNVLSEAMAVANQIESYIQDGNNASALLDGLYSKAMGYVAQLQQVSAGLQNLQNQAASWDQGENGALNSIATAPATSLTTLPPITITTLRPTTTTIAPTTTTTLPPTTTTQPVAGAGSLALVAVLDPTLTTCSTYAANGTTAAGKCIGFEAQVQNPSGQTINASVSVSLSGLASMPQGFELDPLAAGWSCTDLSGKALTVNTDPTGQNTTGTEIRTLGFACTGPVPPGVTVATTTSSGSTPTGKTVTATLTDSFGDPSVVATHAY